MSNQKSKGRAKSVTASEAQRTTDAEQALRRQMFSFAPEILGMAAPLPRRMDGSERVVPRTDR